MKKNVKNQNGSPLWQRGWHARSCENHCDPCVFSRDGCFVPTAHDIRFYKTPARCDEHPLYERGLGLIEWVLISNLRFAFYIKF